MVSWIGNPNFIGNMVEALGAELRFKMCAAKHTNIMAENDMLWRDSNYGGSLCGESTVPTIFSSKEIRLDCSRNFRTKIFKAVLAIYILFVLSSFF